MWGGLLLQTETILVGRGSVFRWAVAISATISATTVHFFIGYPPACIFLQKRCFDTLVEVKMSSQKIESGHKDVVHDVGMDYYGKRLATASSDTTIKISVLSSSSGSTSSQQLLATLSGHQGPVWQVSWAHPKFGPILASCSYDGRVIIWKEATRRNEWVQTHVFTDHKVSVNSISWAPHELGFCLACGSSDGNISIFTARADGGWDTARIGQAHWLTPILWI